MQCATTMHWTLFLFVIAFAGLSDSYPTTPSTTDGAIRRVKRRYYVCPPDFIRLGNNCYFLSKFPATWQQAHYECKDRQSMLATLEKAHDDRHLRSYLNRPELARTVRWIDGIYDWQRKKWTWGSAGRPILYHGFSRRNPNTTVEELKWQCVIMDPSMNYKWSSGSCVEPKHFICRTRLHKVTKNGRKELRERWNVDTNKKLNQITVPDQFSEIADDLKKHRRTGNETTNIKSYMPNGKPHRSPIESNAIVPDNRAFGHRNNHTNVITRRRRKNYGKGRKNRCKKILSEAENSTLNAEQIECKKILDKWRNKMNKQMRKKKQDRIEHITMRTYLMEPRVSELHPKPILEVHDF